VHQYRELSQQLLVTSPEEAQKIRNKLLHFLETSSHYTPETVLVHFPYDCEYVVIIYPCFAARNILYTEQNIRNLSVRAMKFYFALISGLLFLFIYFSLGLQPDVRETLYSGILGIYVITVKEQMQWFTVWVMGLKYIIVIC
jgi:hypothetical protein